MADPDDDDPRSWRSLDEQIERAEASHARRDAIADDPGFRAARRGNYGGRPMPALEVVLEFESRWPRHTGRKEGAIIDAFEISAALYYQHLNRLIDTKEALELNPMLVNRLRDQREARTKARASRSFRRNT